MNKFNKTLIFGIVAVVVVVGLVWFLNPEGKMNNVSQDTTGEQKKDRGETAEALYLLISVADSVSGIKSLGNSKFEVVNMNGRSANFGISESDGVRSEDILEEQMMIFQEIGSPTNNISEVDIATNKVVSMHRTISDSGEVKSAEELEQIAQQFVERVSPDFTQIESTLEFSSSGKGETNLFFRWEDKRFTLPDGLEMDLPPFIQVGITSNGYIFSYDNTVQLYSNLSKEALRAICAFVEMPRTDDSSLNREKGTVTVWFTEYEPFQNRYLVLPYEPETDFEGCSESAKTYLGHIPNDLDKN